MKRLAIVGLGVALMAAPAAAAGPSPWIRAEAWCVGDAYGAPTGLYHVAWDWDSAGGFTADPLPATFDGPATMFPIPGGSVTFSYPDSEPVTVSWDPVPLPDGPCRPSVHPVVEMLACGRGASLQNVADGPRVLAFGLYANGVRVREVTVRAGEIRTARVPRFDGVLEVYGGGERLGAIGTCA